MAIETKATGRPRGYAEFEEIRQRFSVTVALKKRSSSWMENDMLPIQFLAFSLSAPQ